MISSLAKSAVALAAALLLSLCAVPVAHAGGNCGDGNPDFGEGCDDGDTESGDGCNENCLIENFFECGVGGPFAVGDLSCASGICDESVDPDACVPDEPPTTSTTVTTTSSTTTSTTSSTTTSSTTSTTLIDSTSTTIDTTTTTLAPTGACCYGSLCEEETEDYCTGELGGSWNAEGTTCDDPGICVDCGNGCVNFGEQCDDADTQTGDGCDDGCQQEECFDCGVIGFLGKRGASICFGPSVCSPSEVCSVCGNESVEFGEQCDDGNTQAGDCCGPTCDFETAGSACPDNTFCDGAETCDGSGNCNDAPDPTCSQFDTECTNGFCDPQLDGCISQDAQDGIPCAGLGSCTTSSGGECENGVCIGEGATLSPSCRWIIIGGSPDGDVRVRTGPGSMVDADMCSDTARLGGITIDNIIVTSTTGEGIRFYGPALVDGDIATGGSTVRSNLYLTIPGTNLKFVDTGMTVAKLPLGEVNTTGTHPLVEVCSDDQDLLAAARNVLDSMGNAAIEEGDLKGLKIGIGGSHTIDVTGQGIAVVDMNGLKVSQRGTLTLKGNADDVVMLRVNGGRLKIGYGSTITLDGLVPQNVLIYADGFRCRMSPGVIGAGTIFCPEAGRFIIGAGVDWSGTFLGATREVRVKSNADLVHVPFTGF